jgi:hypothetical protein
MALFVDIWTTCELCISIIVVCMPSLPPLLRRVIRVVRSAVSGQSALESNGYDLTGRFTGRRRGARNARTATNISTWWDGGGTSRPGQSESESDLNPPSEGGKIYKPEEVIVWSQKETGWETPGSSATVTVTRI